MTSTFEQDKATVADLISGTTDFTVFYTTGTRSAPATTAQTGPLLVLDASFNPPHNAHLALLTEAVRHYSSQASPQTPPEVEVLVLMATNNADKPGQDAANYARRMHLMRLFADALVDLFQAGSTEATARPAFYGSTGVGLKVSVGLTSRSRFTDKFAQLAVHPSFNPTPTTDRGIVFLVGFDTLVRILDPKYYPPPSSVAKALGGEFEARVRFFVLARDMAAEPLALTGTGAGNGTTGTPSNRSDASQSELEAYVRQVAAGAVQGVPAAWATRIDAAPATPASEGVSSTAVRRASAVGSGAEATAAAEAAASVRAMTPKKVGEYIIEHGIYENQ